MSACASNTTLLKLLLLAWQDYGGDILNTVKKITYMYSSRLLYLLLFFYVTCNCCFCLHFMIYFLSVDCFVVTGGKKRLVTAKSTLPKKINELEIICKVKEIEEERDGEERMRERGRIR